MTSPTKLPIMKRQLFSAVTVFSAIALLYSCQKSIEEPVALKINSIDAAKAGMANLEITPYQFERINQNNFYSQGWKEQQVNIVSGTTIFSDESDYEEIVCGPDNNSDPRLIQGCVTMNLPTSADPTLRRIRLRRGGYSGTYLADLDELKYSTYVVNNAPTIMVLQIDVNGDETKDFNIYYDPQAAHQEQGFPPVVLNTWQQWDPLHQGVWHIEAATVPLPGELEDDVCTIQEVIAEYPNARIIDTPPMGHNGEGVRFTIGGTPSYLYANTIGYFDALIIGTKNQQHATLFDFACNHSDHQ
jgi:hypothetical protein